MPNLRSTDLTASGRRNIPRIQTYRARGHNSGHDRLNLWTSRQSESATEGFFSDVVEQNQERNLAAPSCKTVIVFPSLFGRISRDEPMLSRPGLLSAIVYGSMRGTWIWLRVPERLQYVAYQALLPKLMTDW